ncbi:hypothetical protein MN0502_34500 (plasmid) [Arthrobacter sp. MN05-02]|nr:hypothetical protein MN0502_34500 [Arthrobacter sp. MN05-02]
MKLALSSLGMPGADIDDLIRCAEEGKADGLELRIGDGEAITTNMPATTRQVVRRRIEDAGLTLIAISSYIKICSPEPDAEVISALHDTLELAAAVGAGGVRIFPGASGPGRAKDWDHLAAVRLSAAAEVASSLGIKVLLETHDSHPTGADIARILHLLEPSGTTMAIWDVLHPWRHGESPEDTSNALRGYLAYCQFKDATIEPDGVTLTLPGQGTIPITEIAARAEMISKDQGDKTFWACLEWEKAWHPHLTELPEALAALRAILIPETTS